MKMNLNYLFRISVVFTLTLCVYSCSSTPLNEDDPISYYKSALDDVDSSRYVIALEKLRTIRHKFPYSSISADAQLKIADVYYLQEAFLEAAFAYKSFIELHPKHKKTAYAFFRIGDSYFQSSPTNIARDLTPAISALNAFGLFIEKFPHHENSKLAHKKISEIGTLLSEKELYIADFYYNQDAYDAAKARYKKLIKVFPNSPYVEEAREQLESLSERGEKK